jgi:hypothetical protein
MFDARGTNGMIDPLRLGAAEKAVVKDVAQKFPEMGGPPAQRSWTSPSMICSASMYRSTGASRGPADDQ